MSNAKDRLSPRAEQIFDELRVSALADGGIGEEGIDELRSAIDAHLLDLQKLGRKNEMMPLDMAEGIASGLHVLLDELGAFSKEQQAAIVAAGRYFCSDSDELPDRESILGLDDDAGVFNFVARLLGRRDLEVDL